MVERRDESVASAAPRTRRELREAEARAAQRSRAGVPTPTAADAGPAMTRCAPTAADASPALTRLARATADATPTTRRPTRPAPATTVVVRRPPARRRTAGSRALSFLVMLVAPALFVGLSIPASAFMSAPDAMGAGAPTSAALGQSVAVSDAAVAGPASRADYTVTSYAELLRQKYGNRTYSYTVGTGAVQWPFPYSVPITDGYGERVAPCRGCSTFHRGLDFVPGAGTPIYAIAAGTVTESVVSGSGFGNYVMIEHTIGGKSVVSLYAHMAMGSSPLVVGEEVAVGDFVGLVGSTGVATAPHLHLEVHVGGSPVDPYTWLVANAAR